MTTMPLGEVKTHLSELVGRVHDHHERVTVTVHGRPSAVLLAVEDLERLEETLAIVRDPETMRRLAESDAELARGEAVSEDELTEAVRRRSSHEGPSNRTVRVMRSRPLQRGDGRLPNPCPRLSQ